MPYLLSPDALHSATQKVGRSGFATQRRRRALYASV
jgi:hypothetical protein